MTQDYDPEALAKSYIMVGLDYAAPSPTNPRKTFNEKTMAELTESVKEHGVLQAIIVRPWPLKYPQPSPLTTYEIVAGERRYRASKAAGLTMIEAKLRDLSDKEVFSIQIIENLQREGLHPLEEADGYRYAMTEGGYTAEQLAKEIKQSRSYIFGRLKLLDLDPESRRLFEAGKLNASTALMVARIPSIKLRAKAIDEISGGWGQGEMSVRQALKHIQNRYMLKLAEAPFPQGDGELVPAAGRCYSCPKRTGNAPDIFEDVQSADVCTDPECYAAKKEAHIKREAEQAIAAGAKVISGDDARKVAPYGTDSTLKNFTRLDEKCYDDPDRRTYREILGDSDTVLIEDVSKNRLVAALPNKVLKEKLIAAGVGQVAENDKKAEKAAQELKLERAYRRELNTRLRTEIWHQTGRDVSSHELPDWDDDIELKLLRHFATQLWGRTYDQTRKLIASLWDTVGPNATEREKAFALRLPQLTRGEIWRLMVDLCTATESSVENEWSLKFLPENTLAIGELFGINAAALRKEVIAAEKEKAKLAKKTPKKQAKPPTPATLAEALPPSEAAQATEVDRAREEAAQAAEPKAEETPETPPAGAGLIESDEKPTAADKPRAIYCHPENSDLTWNGRGRKPKWVEAWLASGRTIDELKATATGGNNSASGEANETPIEAPPKFAVGDRVRVRQDLARDGIKNTFAGREGVVMDAGETTTDHIVEIDGKHAFYEAAELELLPAFRPFLTGDRVKIRSTAKAWKAAGQDAILGNTIGNGMFIAVYGPNRSDSTAVSESEILEHLASGRCSWEQDQSSAADAADEEPTDAATRCDKTVDMFEEKAA